MHRRAVPVLQPLEILAVVATGHVVRSGRSLVRRLQAVHVLVVDLPGAHRLEAAAGDGTRLRLRHNRGGHPAGDLLLRVPLVGDSPLEDPADGPNFLHYFRHGLVTADQTGHMQNVDVTYRFLQTRRGVGGADSGARREAELVHHPLRFGALAGAATVIDEGFLEPDAATAGVYRPVDAGGLPETSTGDPVRTDTVPVLPSPQAEEVPFLVATNRVCLCT